MDIDCSNVHDRGSIESILCDWISHLPFSTYPEQLVNMTDIEGKIW